MPYADREKNLECMRTYYRENRAESLRRRKALHAANPEPGRQRSRDFYWSNRDHQLTQRKLSQYGISREQYEEMVVRQAGICAACGNEEQERSSKGYIRALCIDHDHDTGQVRGLLCGSCNRALGHAKESVERLESLIHYLKVFKGPDPKPLPKPKKGKK